MAEAHSAVALSFTVTHDGVSVSYDQELLRDLWHSFQRGYKRRIGRFKNNFMAGMFPANHVTISIVIGAISLFSMFRRDLSFGILPFIEYYILSFLFGDGYLAFFISLLISGAFIWFVLVQLLRLSIKLLLSYKGWMYETPGKPISKPTKLWLGILKLMSMSGPMLHSYQGALPHLPLPSLEETLERHLLSMKPILNDEEFAELEHLTEVFRKGVGRRLQRYLTLKSWLSTNYVTDWWEEFVYLRQRSPIMINSNYYGFDTLYEHPTTNQGARAANVTYCALQFRRQVERQEISPFSISPQAKVPFCTMQYERLFNSCRVPGEEGILKLMSMSGPMLHSYQGALPHLPLPSLEETLERHLLSMKPILNDEEFAELEHLTEVFRKGVGRRLQRYLTLKSWLSTNYVTDWWEEFVYLRQRSPIMINSNYYGFDTLYEHPTTNQGARAANVTYCALQFRRQVERQEISPVRTETLSVIFPRTVISAQLIFF
ncbi:Choline/Carnitine O-acyltransferase [Cooperia oncophora]